MSKLTNHLIYRQYLTIVRCEYKKPSELGDQLFIDTNNKETDGILPTVQTEWNADEILMKTLNRDGYTDDQIFALGVIRKPGKMENRIICGELKRRYGVFILRSVEGFDTNGDFILPRADGYLMAEKSGNLITGFGFHTELARLFNQQKTKQAA